MVVFNDSSWQHYNLIWFKRTIYTSITYVCNMIIADVATHTTNDLKFRRTSWTTWSLQPPPLDDLGLARFHQFLMAWNDHTEQMRSTIQTPDSFHVLVLDVSLLLLFSLWKSLEQTTSGTCSMEERVGFVGKTWCYVRFLHAPRFLPKQ